MKISEIKELIQIVAETDINELCLEKEEMKLVLRKVVRENPAPQPQFVTAMPTLPAMAAFSQALPTERAPLATADPEADMLSGPQTQTLAPTHSNTKAFKAPMVGTFYRASRPGAEPFVSIGDRVKAGQTVCIIEAMKLMNQIEAEFSGLVVDILIKDGEPVEYGQNMFIVEPES